MDTQAFIADVQRRAALSSAAEARRVSEQVLRSLAQVLPAETAAALRAELPAPFAQQLAFWHGTGDELVDRETFIGPLVNDLHTTYLYDQSYGGMDLVSVYADDDAARRVQAVFAALKQRLGDEKARSLEQALPPEIADWFRAAR